MDKKYWHHIWMKRVRPVKVWYLLVLLACSVFVCVSALRANNIKMGQVRDAVYTADKNNANVEGALQNLQMFVTSHMNTNLTAGAGSVYPPIQLKYTYQRLQDAANQKAAEANQNLYTEAQKYCEQQDSVDFSGHNRVPCIEQYVSGHGGPAAPQIPDSMYKFNFISPSWSPDLAGWSLVASILLAAALVVRLLLGWLLLKFVK
ncbi:MAG TPA: hypothetical protein VLG16_01400 [Candidatus Saccharimonadales bacterium]|nr:hypothetical protein [Candidatus Saccharimonadales bacterium]